MANAVSRPWRSRRLVLLLVLSVALSAPISPAQGAVAGKRKELAAEVHEAQVLIDNYRGRPEDLRRASDLISTTMKEDNSFAPAYVQAARLILVGGHIVSDDFAAGTLDKAEQLLQKAITLNPREAEAFVLLGHVNELAGKLDEALTSLDRARSLGSRDPWLQNNYGAYYLRMNQPEIAARYYRKVSDVGPGKTSQRRSAYIDATTTLQWLAALKEDNDAVIAYGKLATSAASPDDAWTWGNVGNVLFIQGYFDEAIDHARKALSIMDYGVGREVLALALYGKWASLSANGHSTDGEPYFTEAYALEPDLNQVVWRFKRSADPVRALVPIVERRMGHGPN